MDLPSTSIQLMPIKRREAPLSSPERSPSTTDTEKCTSTSGTERSNAYLDISPSTDTEKSPSDTDSELIRRTDRLSISQTRGLNLTGRRSRSMTSEEMRRFYDPSLGRSSTTPMSDDSTIEVPLEGNENVLQTLSGIYADILIIGAGVSVLTKVQGSSPYFHDIFYLYLLVVGIILLSIPYCIKIFRVYIKKYEQDRPLNCLNWICYSNVAIKLGTLAYGTALVMISLLEFMAVIYAAEKCVSSISASQPLLISVFVMLQISFIINTKAKLQIYGCIKDMALAHLLATNMALWINLFLWEGAREWGFATHIKHNSSVGWNNDVVDVSIHSLESNIHSKDVNQHYPRHEVHYTSNCYWEIQKNQVVDVISIQYCLQNSTIGQVWYNAEIFFYPFKTQYYFLIMHILYALWIKYECKHKRFATIATNPREHEICRHSTKGGCTGGIFIFAGILLTIIYFKRGSISHFHIAVLRSANFVISGLVAFIGLIQIRKMYDYKSSKDIKMIMIYQKVGLLAVYIYSCCNANIGSNSTEDDFLFIFESIVMIFHNTVQYLFVIHISRKRIDASNFEEKPGRQVVMFLILSNAALCLIECFIAWDDFQKGYTILSNITLWLVITRCLFPVIVFYRFHSAIILLDVWFNAFKLNY